MPEQNLLQPMDTKRKCPLSVIVIGCLFAAAGAIGIVHHANEFNVHSPEQQDLILVSSIRLLAVVAAVFLFFGHNWARWLLIIWLAFHIVLSAFHSVSQVLMHSLLLGIVAYFLFRPQTSAFFRRQKPN
jgi:hypothetical protein